MHILLKWVLLWSFGWLLYAEIRRELFMTNFRTYADECNTLYACYEVSYIAIELGITQNTSFAHNNSNTTRCGQ